MKKGRLLAATLACLSLLLACSKGGQPSEDPAIAAIKAAQDKVAQSLLLSAMVSSKSYFVGEATYAGFDPGAASAIEPGFKWSGGGAATVGSVSIDLADGPQLVLSTRSQSGRPFCMADGAPSGIISGSVDAKGASSAAACTGASW
jgi:hypothetical protein